MKYVKLDLTLGERFKLLFFGIVSEDRLPTIEVVKEIEKEQGFMYNFPNVPVPPPSTNINKGEDELELHIPFFGEDDSDVKSNF